MLSDVKTILRSVREFKKPTILCLIFIIGEVIMEVLIPFITSYLVNRIKAGEDLSGILVTRDEDENLSIFAKEKSWIFTYISWRRFLASPEDA